MATLLVVMGPKRTSSLLRWAKHLSAADGQLVVLCCSPNGGLDPDERRRSEDKIYGAVMRMTAAMKETFEVRKVSSDNPAEVVLAEAILLDAVLVDAGLPDETDRPADFCFSEKLIVLISLYLADFPLGLYITSFCPPRIRLRLILCQ